MRDYTFEYKYSQEGDIIIGGIFTVHSAVHKWNWEGIPFVNFMCSAVHKREYTHLLAFIFAIKEINRNPDILPNVTLGYHVYDSCGDVKKATKDVLQILSGHTKEAPNYSCMERDNVAGFIGDLKSDTTLQMAQLLYLYGYTQISYGAGDSLLSDRKMYPNVFRTVPDNEMQYVAIVKLLKKLKWNWVGIITSDDEYGEREIQQLSKHLTDHGICIEFKILVSISNYKKILPELQTSTSEVLIICGTVSRTFYNFLIRTVPYHVNKTFILPDSWSLDKEHFIFSNCSLVFTSPNPPIPGMQEYFHNNNYSNNPDDPTMEDIIITQYACLSRNPMKNYLIPMTVRYPIKYCNLTKLKINMYYHDDKSPYRVFLAVNIMAWAIHDIYNYQKNKEPESVKSLHRLKNKVARYVKAIYNKGSNNKKTHFKEKGDWTSSLDIVNWITYLYLNNKNVTRWRPVGQFDESLPESQQFTLNPQLISWKHGQIPISRCNARCSPGYRKAPRGRIHACCYDCIPCSEGEVSNLTDSEHCFRCPEDEWPDKKKVECIPKIYEFLSYENDTMASVFSFISLIFSAVTLFVLVKFISNRNTPIVRANNRTVSFILLTSILLSFLSVFLFLGRPVDITCKLRQISFGIFFSIAVASVLAKTTTVCIAFKATKPDSSWKKWVTVKIFNSLVLTCSSVQVLICVIWLSVSPPYQEYDMHSSPGKIIIQCNEGSVIGFYSVLGYIGFLAAVSFVLAFMVRTLPDSFNEAKYITFSMLVFCSVWIVWIPVYLSAKGKYMVTVEIFAILASSAGLLGCIFFPKCYIIILKPEMNTRKKTLHIK